MINQEKRTFHGKMDSDTEDRHIAGGDYRWALNIRNGVTDQASRGSVENPKGNQLVSFSLPAGQNTCVGTYDDIRRNRVIYFLFNSSGSHSMMEYDAKSNTITTVLQGSVLNLDPNFLINDIDRIEDIVVWSDRNNEIRSVNIERAKAGSYPTPLTEDFITLIKRPPPHGPSVVYVSDPDQATNNLANKFFQFRTKFVYEDSYESTWSPISVVPFPTSGQSTSTATTTLNPTIDNGIDVTMVTGDGEVRAIKVSVREFNTGDFVLADTLDKARLSIADDSTFVYRFFNNTSRLPIALEDSNLLFSQIPRRVNSIALSDDNRLMAGGIIEGFDPVTTDVDVAVSYDDFQAIPVPLSTFDHEGLTLNNISPGDIDIDPVTFVKTSYSSGTADAITFEYNHRSVGTDERVANYIDFEVTLVHPNNKLTFAFNWDIFENTSSPGTTHTYPGTPARSENFEVVVLTNEQDTPTTLAVKIFEILSAQPQTFVNAPPSNSHIPGGTDLAVFRTSETISICLSRWLNDGTIDSKGIGTVTLTIEKNLTKSFPSLKHGASRRVGLVYYDKYNRSTLVNLDRTLAGATQLEKNQVFVENFPESSPRGSAKMALTVNHLPPAGFTHYQVVVTRYDTTDFFSFRIIDAILTDVSGRRRLQIRTMTQEPYSFVPGDRIRMVADETGAYFSETTEFNIETYDLGTAQIVMGADVDISFFPEYPVDGGQMVVEIIRPKVLSGEEVYYEIGQCYPISGGFHVANNQTQTGVLPAIIDVDYNEVYIRERSDYPIIIESANVSDFITSNVWDQGRPNRFDDNIKEIFRPTTVIYTEQFVPETQLNGLSISLDGSFKTYDIPFGAIEKLYTKDDRLYLFQQKKVGYTLVNQSILRDEGGNIVGARGIDTILNEITYYSGEFGIGTNPESFAIYGNSMYFTDVNRGTVLRLANDGITTVSAYGQTNFFFNSFREMIRTNRPFRVLGVFDVRFNQYIIHVPDIQSEGGGKLFAGFTFGFNEGDNGWSSFFSYMPEMIGSSDIDVVSFKDGALWVHNQNVLYNNFYGEQFSSDIIFVFNGIPEAVKVWQSLYLSSNVKWEFPEIKTPSGSESSLLTTDFEDREGVFKAALLRDVNTPAIVDPLINGDTLRGQSLEVRVRYTGDNFVRLFAITAHYITSELTNR